MKKLFSVMALITLIAVIIIACKDTFNESDFLNLQNKLKTQQDSAKLNQQIKELNQAGSLLSFTVQVVEDRTPLQGVDVQVSNDVTSGSVKVTTDANGNAVFSKASVGSNTIILSKSGYITSTAIVDFGALSAGTYYTTVTGTNGATNIVPLKQAKAVLLPMFSTGGTGSTATIKGKVTIETDLTNTTPEVPQGLTIRANYASGIAAIAQGGNGVNVISYSFNQAGIGVATVDNITGLYSMTVPATAAGMQMSLLLPVIDANQKLAVVNLDGKPIATGPQYRNVPTSFGPTIAPDFSIPSIPGAMLTFAPAPVDPGAGVKFTFTAAPRSLTANFGLWTMNYNNNFGSGQAGNGPSFAFQAGATQWQLTNVGAGYTSAPSVTVTGGGATTDAKIEATLGGVLTSLTLGNAGTGYVDGTIGVTMRFKDVNNNNIPMYSFNANIKTTSGAITSLTLPSSISGLNGLDPSRPFHTVDWGNGYGIKSFDVILTGGNNDATATATFATFVDGVRVTSSGAGYTSAPTITFSGGGATTQAVLSILEWRSKWTIGIDNSSNTAPYKILPPNIYMVSQHTNGNIYTETAVTDQVNNFYNNMWNQLTVNSNGQIVWINPSNTYTTNDFMLQPNVVIDDYQKKNAIVWVIPNVNGTISNTSLNVVQSPKGYASAVTVSVVPTISTAPGSGATIVMQDATLDPHTKEYTFSPYNSDVKQSGANYLPDLNQQNNAPISGGWYSFNGNTGTFSIKTNDVQVFNFNYGTGKRKENVN